MNIRTDLAPTGKLAQPGVSPAADPSALQQAARGFEALFLQQVIGAMRQANLGDGLFDSSATQNFQAMMDSRLADQFAQSDMLGFAEAMTRQFGGNVKGSE
jgi:flagellar protein FlgJ